MRRDPVSQKAEPAFQGFRSSFLVVPYVEGEGGLRPAVKPLQCPAAGPGEVCGISLQGFRHRATGPVEWLQKARCRVHGYFTLYPCGQVPHGRHRVAPVEPGGHVVDAAEGEAACTEWKEGIPSGGAGCRGQPAVAPRAGRR